MRTLRWLVVALVLALALLMGAADPGSTKPQSQAQGAVQAAPAGSAAGEILVKFKPGTSEGEKEKKHEEKGGRPKEVIPGIDVQVVDVGRGQEKSKAKEYENDSSVQFAEPNGSYQAIATTNDPYVGKQWQYNNTGQTGGKYDADIDAFEAWNVTAGSSAVPIAVLDTGIDQSHADLRSKIYKNKNFTTSSTVDDGYGHGTHVAGSAGAVTNNSTGVAGTCPRCVLYNVKVLGDTGSGQLSWIANGIVWAADNGAKVINMSLGSTSPSSTLQSAINYAWSKGVVLTAAAGNNGTNTPVYPAYYTNVIAVAATDASDTRATFSEYGASWVDVAAPGRYILSTAPDHANSIWGTGVKYGTLSGTSMASPHVAGEAGLIWSTGRCGTANNSCVRSRIQGRADRIAGTGTYWAYGRVNAYRAVLP